MIAPTGTGKTSLIKTIVQYIRENIGANDNFKIATTNIEAEELSDMEFIGSTNSNFQDVYVGSSSCTQYDFSIKYKDANIEIEQPFSIMDYPGGYIGEREQNQNESEYAEFYKHLSKSQILWIPIDSPILMSAITKDEKECSRRLRCLENVKKYIQEDWLGFIKTGELDKYFCNFVLLKSESYFSQDVKKKYGFCKRQFDEDYEDIVKYIKDNSLTTQLSCVAVETYGSCEVKTIDWDVDKNICDVKYRATGSERNVRGVQSILKDCMFLAIDNMNKEVRTLSMLRNEDRAAYQKQLEILVAQAKEKLESLNTKLTELAKAEKDELYIQKRINEENDRFWLYFFRGGVREELSRQKGKIKALIEELEKQKGEEESKLANLENQKNMTKVNLNDVDSQIKSLETVITEFGRLSGKERNTDQYYRYL